MQPKATVVGQVQDLAARSFKNDQGETITFIQISILNPTDQYNPFLRFTVDQQVVPIDEVDDYKEKLVNQNVVMTGSIYMQSREVNGVWTRQLKIKIDDSIELLDE